MKLIIQRIKHARVEVDGKEVSSIRKGLLIFIGISKKDDGTQIEWLAKKTVELRIFEDDQDKMRTLLPALKAFAIVFEICFIISIFFLSSAKTTKFSADSFNDFSILIFILFSL